ncbi:hypothetical protein A8H39_01835 [Paraburkholderia fungorum]|nr:hypothetical protein A8H39_01835 [Paraburkholderia fungorum]
MKMSPALSFAAIIVSGLLSVACAFQHLGLMALLLALVAGVSGILFVMSMCEFLEYLPGKK